MYVLYVHSSNDFIPLLFIFLPPFLLSLLSFIFLPYFHFLFSTLLFLCPFLFFSLGNSFFLPSFHGLSLFSFCPSHPHLLYMYIFVTSSPFFFLSLPISFTMNIMNTFKLLSLQCFFFLTVSTLTHDTHSCTSVKSVCCVHSSSAHFIDHLNPPSFKNPGCFLLM